MVPSLPLLAPRPRWHCPRPQHEESSDTGHKGPCVLLGASGGTWPCGEVAQEVGMLRWS